MGQFEKMLAASIQEGLKNLLGRTAMEAMIFHLNVDMARPDLDMIQSNLQRIFGRGAEIIEKVIVEELYFMLGIDARDSLGLDFRERVAYAKDLYLNEIIGCSQKKRAQRRTHIINDPRWPGTPVL